MSYESVNWRKEFYDDHIKLSFGDDWKEVGYQGFIRKHGIEAYLELRAGEEDRKLELEKDPDKMQEYKDAKDALDRACKMAWMEFRRTVRLIHKDTPTQYEIDSRDRRKLRKMFNKPPEMAS